MKAHSQTDEAIRQLQEEFGWTEEEARRFRRRASRMLVDDIVFVPPLTAAERRELGLDLKVGDELDDVNDEMPPADHIV